MPVMTDLYLLTENPEAEGEWIGYPETVALTPGAPFLCRLCYRYETEEPGGFTGIETEVCFTDECGLISHIVPVGVPEQTGYSVERSGGAYRVRFIPKDPYAESGEEKIEFVVEVTGDSGENDAVFSSTVGFSCVFRGEGGDRQIGLEKPGPVWMVLEKASEPEVSVPESPEPTGDAAPCGISCGISCRHEDHAYCPRIVKMVPPGEFWRPDTASSSKKDAPPYRTIGVARRQARKHFYW